MNRARIIGYQLGPVLEALEGVRLTPGLATVTSLEERRERVS